MTRLAVPSRPRSPLDEVRRALDRIEALLVNLRGTGPEALEVLRLLDRVAERLERLEAAGADVRAERARLDGAWQRLQRQARVFLKEVGPALRDKRASKAGGPLRPWWTLDELYAQRQRQALGRGLLIGLVAALLLALGWAAYERFLAPPPEVRQALQHAAHGQQLLKAGDVAGALAEFEAAAHLTPDDPEAVLWVGVLRRKLGDEAGAQAAFERAQGLGLSQEQYLVQRGTLFLEAGELEWARADAEAAIRLAPDWGYGFYLRASVEAAAGEGEKALADYQRAADLAYAANDAELEALARAQIGFLLQYGNSSFDK